MLFYWIIIIWIILDLFSKYLANLYLQEKIGIFWDIFFLQYVENKGIAFSIDIPFLKIVTIILIIWIFVYYIQEEKKKNSKIVDFSFGLILAWAIWNGIERVFNGFVIDFLWVQWFAVFNLADSCITIWACLYIYYVFMENKKK